MATSSHSRGLLKAAHNGQDPGNLGGAQGHDRSPDEVAISGSPISSHCTLVGQKKCYSEQPLGHIEYLNRYILQLLKNLLCALITKLKIPQALIVDLRFQVRGRTTCVRFPHVLKISLTCLPSSSPRPTDWVCPLQGEAFCLLHRIRLHS